MKCTDLLHFTTYSSTGAITTYMSKWAKGHNNGPLSWKLESLSQFTRLANGKRNFFVGNPSIGYAPGWEYFVDDNFTLVRGFTTSSPVEVKFLFLECQMLQEASEKWKCSIRCSKCCGGIQFVHTQRWFYYMEIWSNHDLLLIDFFKLCDIWGPMTCATFIKLLGRLGLANKLRLRRMIFKIWKIVK